MNHLKEGEAEKLRAYFDDKTNKTLVKVAEEVNMKDRILLLNKADQDGARDRDYEKLSSFGRTRKEIRANATAHLRQCDYCLAEYEIAVKKKALTVPRIQIRVSTKISEPMSFERINKNLAEQIKHHDVLGLLIEQKQ